MASKAITRFRPAISRAAAAAAAATAAPASPMASSLPRAHYYHSYDHPPPPGPFSPIEASILSAALPHVPSYGFTLTALSMGAKDAGYIDASTNLFPSGPFALVHYHLATQRLGLATAAKDVVASQEMGVAGKVRTLAWERLMGNKDVVHRWQEALALVAQPSNVPTSVSELSKLSDEIWFLSGDTAVDSTWYTKRASLSTVYAASELYMTTDKSPEYRDTKEFLDRRFKDVEGLGKAVSSVGEWIGFTAHATLNVLRSKGVGI